MYLRVGVNFSFVAFAFLIIPVPTSSRFPFPSTLSFSSPFFHHVTTFKFAKIFFASYQFYRRFASLIETVPVVSVSIKSPPVIAIPVIPISSKSISVKSPSIISTPVEASPVIRVSNVWKKNRKFSKTHFMAA